MKTENENQNVQSTSNTTKLKKLTNLMKDPRYQKALAILKKAEKRAYDNGDIL